MTTTLEIPTTSFVNRPFEYVCQIGEGAYGRVVLYFDRSNNSLHVAKYCNQSLNTPEEKLAFQRETETLSTFSYPSAVKLFRFGCAPLPDSPYIEMEFIPGGNLHELIASRFKRDGSPLPLPILLPILLGIARALSALHEQKIIHRDIKPSNILIDENYEPYLTDFGFACRIEGADLLTSRGTCNYMAPEVLSESYTTAVDVYSFGLVIWEARKGEMPFKDLTSTDIYGKVQKLVKPPLPHYDIFYRVYEGCTANPPERRWRMNDVANELIEIGRNYTEPQEFQRLEEYDRRLSQGDRGPLTGKLENLVKAAGQKLPVAMAVYGCLLVDGKGFEQNVHEGTRILWEANDLGSNVAFTKVQEMGIGERSEEEMWEDPPSRETM
jgi:serine/threonine protein kinase